MLPISSLVALLILSGYASTANVQTPEVRHPVVCAYPPPRILSKEIKAFNKALAALERGERPNPELDAFGGDLEGRGERQIRDWGLDEMTEAEITATADADRE